VSALYGKYIAAFAVAASVLMGCVATVAYSNDLTLENLEDPVIIAIDKKPSSPISWTYVAPSDGFWTAMIANYGLNRMCLEVFDKSSNGGKVLSQDIQFHAEGAYPSGTVVSEPCAMEAGCPYKIVVSRYTGMIGAYASLWSQFDASDVVILEERFDSWESLDDGWTIWNRTLGSFENWFDVNGTLVASNNGILILSNYDSYANWSREVAYDDLLTISMRIFLPLDCDTKIGWAGQVFILSIEDVSGEIGLIMRWVMDNPGDTYPIGWTYWSAETGHAEQICPFQSGWHTVGLVLDKQTNSWTAFFDGLAYPGLSFSKQTTNGFDIGSVKFINVLREEVQTVMVDDLLIAKGAQNEPPVADFEVSVDGLTVSVDASASWDLEDPVTELEVRWDWQNDGVWDTDWATEKLSSHAYSVGGTYTVILEVRDTGGLSDTANRSVTVQEPSPTEHEPILINGDEGFTYANGVVQGDGTIQNPFVIEGWDIEADTASGICIVNTDAHFVIRDVEVYDGLDYGSNSGISLVNVANGSVDMCMVTNCVWGIGVFSCSGIDVFDNDISGCYYGVGVVDSSEIDVLFNCVSESTAGISVNYTTQFGVSNNTVVNSWWYGVYVAQSQNGWIASNTVSHTNYCGIGLVGFNEQITLFRNALLNNTVQAEDYNLPENSWNYVYPIGGNYWSDYVGIDLYSGPNQDLPGSDGIGDTPYTVGVFDQYPLMEPCPW
jgi:parallel beta-helix repeat protein